MRFAAPRTQSVLTWLMLASLTLSPVALTGCQFFNKPKPAEKAADTDVDSNTPPPTTPENLGPHPLIDNYRPIEATMPDGMKLVGTLYIPGISAYKKPAAHTDEDADSSADTSGDAENAAPKPAVPKITTHYPLIILLHMLSDDRWVWSDLPKQLVAAHYAVLALDMRGHGDSVYLKNRLLVWRQFDTNDWNKLVDDIPAVVDYIHKQPDFGMVDTDDVGIIGASIGANVGVNVAGRQPKTVHALVLLSPGLEYHGIQTFNPITDMAATAVYYLASKEDQYATMSAEKLYKFTQGKKKIQIYEDLGHGTDILNNDPGISKQIIDWLTGVLPPQGGHAAVDAQVKNKPETAKPAATKTLPSVAPHAANNNLESQPGAAAKPVLLKPAPVKKEKLIREKLKPAAHSNPAVTAPSEVKTSDAKASPKPLPQTTDQGKPIKKDTGLPALPKKRKAKPLNNKPVVIPPESVQTPVTKPSGRFDAPVTNIHGGSAPPPPPPVAPSPIHTGPYSQ